MNSDAQTEAMTSGPPRPRVNCNWLTWREIGRAPNFVLWRKGAAAGWGRHPKRCYS